MHNKSTLSFCRTLVRTNNAHTRSAVCDCWPPFRLYVWATWFRIQGASDIQLSKWLCGKKNVWMEFPYEEKKTIGIDTISSIVSHRIVTLHRWCHQKRAQKYFTQRNISDGWLRKKKKSNHLEQSTRTYTAAVELILSHGHSCCYIYIRRRTQYQLIWYARTRTRRPYDTLNVVVTNSPTFVCDKAFAAHQQRFGSVFVAPQMSYGLLCNRAPIV